MFIEHINISSPRDVLEKEKSFFCDLFGLKEGYRPGFQRHGYWLYSGDNALIHLTESNNHSSTGETGYLDHIAFRLNGLSDFVKLLESMSVTYRLVRIPELDVTQLFFKSPSGIGLEASFVNE